MEYVTLASGKITGHFDSVEVPQEAIAVSSDFVGVVGDFETRYDWSNGGTLKSIEDQILLGILEDNRGIWFGTIDQNRIEITEPGIPLPTNQPFTQNEPLSAWDEWSGTDWVLNTIAEQAWLDQKALDTAQDVVDKKLAKTLYDLTSFIEDRFDLTQAEVDQISVMTTVPQLRAVILDRFKLSAGQKAYIKDFRDAYEAWLAKL